MFIGAHDAVAVPLMVDGGDEGESRMALGPLGPAEPGSEVPGPFRPGRRLDNVTLSRSSSPPGVKL